MREYHSTGKVEAVAARKEDGDDAGTPNVRWPFGDEVEGNSAGMSKDSDAKKGSKMAKKKRKGSEGMLKRPTASKPARLKAKVNISKTTTKPKPKPKPKSKAKYQESLDQSSSPSKTSLQPPGFTYPLSFDPSSIPHIPSESHQHSVSPFYDFDEENPDLPDDLNYTQSSGLVSQEDDGHLHFRNPYQDLPPVYDPEEWDNYNRDSEHWEGSEYESLSRDHLAIGRGLKKDQQVARPLDLSARWSKRRFTEDDQDDNPLEPNESPPLRRYDWRTRALSRVRNRGYTVPGPSILKRRPAGGEKLEEGERYYEALLAYRKK